MTDGVKTSPVPRLDLVVAGIALAAIAAYVVMWAAGLDTITFMGRHALDLPLYVAVIASVPLLWQVL